MSPVIRISDSTYEALQSLAEPFKDKTPGDVIDRTVAFYLQHKGKDSICPDTRKVTQETLGNDEVLELPSMEPAILGGSSVGSEVHDDSSEYQTPRGVHEPTKAVTLSSLSSTHQSDLFRRTLATLEIEGEEIPVRRWKDVSSEFVRWLVEKGHITDKRLPILNSAGRGKYFVNTEPDHMDSSKDNDGFMKVSPGIFVDIKYNASAHVKNLLSTLDQLGLKDLSVRIGFAQGR